MNLIVVSLIISTTAPVSYDREKRFLHGSPDHIQWSAGHRTEARATIFGANVVLGCIKSGIGLAINGDRSIPNSLAGGCVRGMFGGAVMYVGEWTATYAKYEGFGALGKLTFDLGNSMTDNVMTGNEMFDQYRTSIGPANITLGRDAHVSFTLTPVVEIINLAARGHKFDYRNSLANLTPMFIMQPSDQEEGIVLGTTRANVLAYSPGSMGLGKGQNIALEYHDTIISHELNHTLFWSRIRFFNDIGAHLIPFDKINRWWDWGQDVANLLLVNTVFLIDGVYYYHPIEIEAYYMNRF